MNNGDSDFYGGVRHGERLYDLLERRSREAHVGSHLPTPLN